MLRFVDEPLIETFPLEVDGARPWKLKFRYAQVNGRLEWIGLEVEPANERSPKPLEHRFLRQVRYADLADRGRKRLLRRHPHLLSEAEPDLAAVVPELTKERPRRGKGRPPAYGSDHYVKVRDTYVEAYRKHEAPTKAVAERFGVPPGTAANWVRKARDLTLLREATEIGKASGAIRHATGVAAGSSGASADTEAKPIRRARGRKKK
jgi:hypothetical protein